MNCRAEQASWLKSHDKLCDEFEARLQAGERPAIADFVSHVPETERIAAFADLLGLEIEYRCDWGEQPQAAEYERTFPDFSDAIKAVFRDIQESQDTAPLDQTVGVQPNYPAGLATRFPGYEVLGEIARGGMGVVYKARQESLDRTVALKVVLSGEYLATDMVERFIGEAKVAAKLHHPAIVTVHEVGQVEGRPYFSMEYVEGQTLSQMLRDGAFSDERAARCVKEIAETIHFAHEQGVLHRDLKPSNVMLDQLDRLRVMDFGLAKHMDADTRLTSSGQILGTPGFMSPEQARGEHAVLDCRSDVYSLGALLYALLTGKAPFESGSVAELMAQVIRDEPVPPSKLESQIDPDLERICLRCLAKNPDDRYETADALATDLASYLTRHVDQQPPRKSGGPLIAVASIAAILLLAAVVIVVKLRDKEITIKATGDTRIEVQDERVTVTSNNEPAGVSGPSVLDQLRRENIDPYELAYAGNGDPDKAPADLVAVLGQSLGRDSRAIQDVAISPDGSRIATVSQQRSRIRLWDARTLQQTANFRTRADNLCFTVDSRTLAVAGYGRNELSIYDLSDSPREVATVPACPPGEQRVETSSVAWSPASRTLVVLVASTKSTPRVRLWKCNDRGIPVDDGGTVVVDEQTRCVAVNGSATMLAAAGSDGKIQLWSFHEQWEVVAELDAEEVAEVAFSPDGKWLAAACGKSGCSVWDVTGDMPALEFVLKDRNTKGYAYRTVAFSQDSTQIASGLSHWAIHLWDVSDTKPSSATCLMPRRARDFTNRIVFSSDEQSIVSGHADGLIRITDITTRPPQPRVSVGGHWSRFAVVEHSSPDCSSVFTRAHDDRLIHWTIEEGRIKESAVTQLSERLTICAVNRPGTLMAAASPYNEQIQVFDLTDGRAMLRRRLSAVSVIRRLAMTQDGSRIAATTESGHVQLWDVATGASTDVDQFRPDDRVAHGVALSPDGHLLAASGAPEDGRARIRLWDISQSPPKHLSHLDIFNSDYAAVLQFSPDGRLLLQMSDDDVNVTDISGARPRRVFSSNTQDSFGQFADFSPDGTMIAVHLSGGKLQLRDTKNFAIQREWTIPAPARPKFAPDSRHLFVGNANGTIYAFRLAEGL